MPVGPYEVAWYGIPGFYDGPTFGARYYYPFTVTTAPLDIVEAGDLVVVAAMERALDYARVFGDITVDGAGAYRFSQFTPGPSFFQTIQVGDTLLFTVIMGAGNSVSLPGGWTTLANLTAGATRFVVLGKAVTAGDFSASWTATYSVTSEFPQAKMWVLRNAPLPALEVTTAAAAATTTITPPPVSPAHVGQNVVALVARGPITVIPGTSEDFFHWPSDWTEIIHKNDSSFDAGDTNRVVEGYSQTGTAAGVTGPGAITAVDVADMFAVMLRTNVGDLTIDVDADNPTYIKQLDGNDFNMNWQVWTHWFDGSHTDSSSATRGGAGFQVSEQTVVEMVFRNVTSFTIGTPAFTRGGDPHAASIPGSGVPDVDGTASTVPFGGTPAEIMNVAFQILLESPGGDAALAWFGGQVIYDWVVPAPWSLRESFLGDPGQMVFKRFPDPAAFRDRQVIPVSSGFLDMTADAHRVKPR